MILAVDVDYRGSLASVAATAFNAFADEAPGAVYRTFLEGVEEYVPGRFYQRELPCILKLLEEHRLRPETIFVDGHVYLDGRSLPGLGYRLYEALGGRVKVIGAAKKRFKETPPECAVYRGGAQRPLYVSAAGLPLEEAKAAVQAMAGPYRIPFLLKEADRLCREKR